MKTIQAIKGTKNVEVGTILRVEDRDADLKVKDGYWKYIPKSEWKNSTRAPKQETETPKQPKKNEKNKK